MRFPRTFVDDLRRQADIVRVIGDYVALKKRGSAWTACCPFHKEKTPSFSVNPARDIYHCFGCGKGGSIYNFVMEIENVTFPESIRIVAEKVGVPIPEMTNDPRLESRKAESQTVLELNAKALEFWQARLTDDTPAAQKTREYLESRGISEETVRNFRLGFAPDEWQSLTGHLKTLGASEADLEISGLVVRKDTGAIYDKFRGRLMFPIMDAQGRPVAFGGRTMSADVEPKYMNSPETALYVKGRHLYGLNITREEIRKKKFAILVEGYLDLLIPFQHGIRNIIASLGTALTPDQAKLISRFARKIVVNYDGDSAGVKAAKRAIETLLAEDVEIKVLVLPDNADPDEFVRSKGAEEYQQKRGEALPHIQFVLEQVLRDRNLLKPADKAAAVEEAMPYIRAVRNPIQKREFFDIAMDALRIDEPALRRELWLQTKTGTALREDVVRKIQSPNVQPTVAEIKLLESLVNDTELRRMILPSIESDDFEELPTAPIFEALIRLEDEGRPVDSIGLMGEVEGDSIAEDIVPVLLISEPLRGEGESVDDALLSAQNCLKAIRLVNVDRRLARIGADLAAAERAGNADRSNRLALDFVELTKLKGELVPRNEAA